MGKLLIKQKREYRTSMFDQYREMIEQNCDAGVPLIRIFKMLPPGYNFSSFYSYIHVRKIRENAWKREVEARNECDRCEYMREFRNAMGGFNKECRMCTKSWRVISASTVHCPRWCELEEEALENIEYDH